MTNHITEGEQDWHITAGYVGRSIPRICKCSDDQHQVEFAVAYAAEYVDTDLLAIIADHNALAGAREELEAWRPIIEALEFAEAGDQLSTFKVNVPKGDYPGQYLVDYLPTALAALSKPASGGQA